jgi:poly(A) polymerase
MTGFTSAVFTMFPAMPELAEVFRTHDAYLVGGAVRDMLTGCHPLDYDIVVRQDPEAIAHAITRNTGAHFFRMGKDRQTVFRGQIRENTIDLVRMAGDSIESDLRLRDFTINAMAVHLGNCVFLDPLLGQLDLANRIIRMVSENAFLSDPLRLLRTYRFAATLNFDIENGTAAAIRTHSRLIRLPAGERIREEMFRLLDTPGATGYLEKMKDDGLLFDLFPELSAAAGCTQNAWHCFDVLDHTLSACRHLEYFLNGNGTADPAFQKAIGEIDNRRKPVLKLAMLLHDIGKPRTRIPDAAGSVHFFGHEAIGASLAAGITSRLKLSNPDADYLLKLVQNHLQPVLLYQAHGNQSLSRKGIVRFFRSLNGLTPDLLIMALADACAKTIRPCGAVPSFSGFIADLLKMYDKDYTRRKIDDRLITGQDLITLFGLKPSPVFKTILEAVEEARLSRTFDSREDAIAWVRSWLDLNENMKPSTVKMIDNPRVP